MVVTPSLRKGKSRFSGDFIRHRACRRRAPRPGNLAAMGCPHASRDGSPVTSRSSAPGCRRPGSSRSMIRKGRNSRNPISNARLSSEIMKAGTRMRSDMSSGRSGRGWRARSRKSCRSFRTFFIRRLAIPSAPTAKPLGWRWLFSRFPLYWRKVRIASCPA